MLFRIVLIITLLLGTTARAQDPASTGDILEDARTIITSARGDVRLWAHPPRVLVFGSGTMHAMVTEMVARVNGAVAAPYGATLVGPVERAALPSDLGAGQDPMWLRLRRGGPGGTEIDINLGPSVRHQADIAIVVADRPSVAITNGLWGVEPSDTRAQMQGGRGRCFYSARSKNGLRYGAYITVFAPNDMRFIEECLWEELLHALGPLTDATGTPHFSFDDTADSFGELRGSDLTARMEARRANDLLLLRALYESGIGPGGSPDQAVAYLARLLD
ncbi:MAG: DUF2927 domain-containing protein [Shimia sp.]